MDYEELQERVDAVAKEDLQKAQKDFQEMQEDKQKVQEKESEKSVEKSLKTDRNVSGGSKKQSVLNALRERQARLKAQEKQGQKSLAQKKGEQEL